MNEDEISDMIRSAYPRRDGVAARLQDLLQGTVTVSGQTLALADVAQQAPGAACADSVRDLLNAPVLLRLGPSSYLPMHLTSWYERAGTMYVVFHMDGRWEELEGVATAVAARLVSLATLVTEGRLFVGAP